MGNEPRIRQTSGHIYNATKFSGNLEGDFDGKRIRKTMVRKTVDYNTAVVKYLEVQFQFKLFMCPVLYPLSYAMEFQGDINCMFLFFFPFQSPLMIAPISCMSFFFSLLC